MEHPISAAPLLRYRSVPLSLLWRPPAGTAVGWLRMLWWASAVACVLLGLATVVFQWSGLAVRFGGVEVYLTVYPPLTLCLLWVLCFGLWWGLVPAYLSTLVLALYSGMAPAWALVFALSNPLGFFVMAVAYRAVQLPVPPRSLGSALFFITVAFIGAVFSATGSFIWTYSGQVDPQAAFAIWQGWWLGGFLQTVFLVGPLLAVFGPAVLRWRNQHVLPPQADALMARWKLMAASLLSVGGVLAFLWLSFHLGRRAWDSLPLPTTPAQMNERLLLVHEATLTVYWIISVLTLSVLFLGYRFFSHWTRELEAARDRAVQQHQATELARRELAQRIEEIQRLQAQLREQAVRDPLTGLYNRRHLQQALPVELQRAQRRGQPVSVVVLDLDHFKQVNDRHGHAMGDRVLKATADLLQSQVRAEDFCARFGGEEFCLVLAGATAQQTMERLGVLLQQYAELVVSDGHTPLSGLSFSAGIAVYPTHGNSDDELLSAADHALYQAKASGRNRVCLASSVGQTRVAGRA